LRPKPNQPVKQFWKVASRECVLYVTDGAFEVRLLEAAKVTRVATCRDEGHAFQTAREWLARRPRGAAPTHCPRCDGAQTSFGNRTEGFVYLRCEECRGVWRIPERRATERFVADATFAGRRPHTA
jgi:hypothetical protein